MGIDNLPVALSVIRPELILAGTALVCIALDLLYKPVDKTPCWAIAFFGCLAALAATIAAWGTEQEAFSQLVRMDNLSNFFAVVFLMAGMITLCLSASYVQREGLMAGEYYTLLLISMTGMLFMAQANDLMTVYLGIEIMSIPVYVLVAIIKKRLDLDISLYTILQILSVTAFEQVSIMQVLTNFGYRKIEVDSAKQLLLIDL